jgi:hypothetical protein
MDFLLPFENLGTIQCNSWLARNIKGALALSGSGGFRLAEVSLIDGSDFTALKMSRASLFFIIKGVVKRCPSAQELSNLKPLEVRPCWSIGMCGEERPAGATLSS